MSFEEGKAATKFEEDAEKLKNDGRLYDAGMRFAQASRLHDVAGDYTSAHMCEDAALWCLRDMCYCITDQVPSITILRIQTLANNIIEPDLNKVCRHYA